MKMKQMARAGAAAFAAAMAGVANAVGPVVHHKGSTRYAFGLRPRNSWYLPHQGKAEIARRQRHAARDEANQLARGASLRSWEAKQFGRGIEEGALRLSRRGNVIA